MLCFVDAHDSVGGCCLKATSDTYYNSQSKRKISYNLHDTIHQVTGFTDNFEILERLCKGVEKWCGKGHAPIAHITVEITSVATISLFPGHFLHNDNDDDQYLDIPATFQGLSTATQPYPSSFFAIVGSMTHKVT
jgi:hypothetical protein